LDLFDVQSHLTQSVLDFAFEFAECGYVVLDLFGFGVASDCGSGNYPSARVAVVGEIGVREFRYFFGGVHGVPFVSVDPQTQS
jgi:hypothetical protein